MRAAARFPRSRLRRAKSARRHASPAGLLLGLLLALPALLGRAAPLPGAALAQDLDDAPIGYRLVEDWKDAPWQLTPGRYGHAADVTATADAWRYVLDRRHQALHLLTAQGEARAILPLQAWLPGEGWEARRIDAQAGSLAILISDGDNSRVQRLDFRQGRRVGEALLLALPIRYNDLALHPDGRLMLSRSIPRLPATPPPRDRGPGPKGGVDIFGADGVFQASLDDRPLFYPIGVDVGPEGQVHVVNRVPSPDSDGPPGPAPTPEPSMLGLALPASPVQDRPEPLPGIVTYAADLSWQSTWEFNAPDDVAAGPTGVFVSRQMELFALGAREPFWMGPTGQVIWPYSGAAPLHLEAPPAGDALIASLAHCYAQGLLSFPAAAPGAAPRLGGGLDNPPLSGPFFPLRIAAGAAPALLQGRFGREPAADGTSLTVIGERPPEPQSVQRWSSDGRLQDQLGICGGLAVPWQVDLSTSWWVRDLAVDGDRLYTLDASALRARPAPGFPAWTAWPDLIDLDRPAPEQIALDARDGLLAVLDAARNEVRLHDEDGRSLGAWPISTPAGEPPLLPIDLALGPDRVYLADAASRRLVSFDRDGGVLGSWSLHDAPAAIASGPSGDLFLLGRGGWAWRYAPDGAQLAWWRLPAPGAVDIAVGDDGRVYVTYAPRERTSDPRGRPVEILRDAGIWVFEPEPGRSLPEPAAGRCRMIPDKTAAPASLLLGGEVEVRLRVEGDCPGRHAGGDLLILFDSSLSMSWDSALDRAREGARQLIGRLDDPATRLGLASFDAQAALQVPLGSAPSRLIEALSSLAPGGDTRLATGLELARATLSADEPSGRRRILLFTDGEYKDTILPEVQALADAGIELQVMLYPVSSFDISMAVNLERLIGRQGSVHVAPGPAEIEAIAAQLTGFEPNPILFEAATVIDRVPGNMRYLPGSARPPADWDPQSRSLTWRVADLPSREGLDLRYRLEPLEPGRWPTNVLAYSQHRDGLGEDGRLDFPVPTVQVLARQALRWKAYLPFTARRDCLRSQGPVDLVLAMDSSMSMAEAAGSGERKLDAAIRAAAQLIDQLTPGRDRVAILGFDAQARELIALTPDLAAARQALARLETRPGTRIDLGLNAAAAVFEASPRDSVARAVLLLSDGRQLDGAAASQPALGRLDRLEARRITIALGEDADAALLAALASSSADAYVSPTADALSAIYVELARKVACGDE